MLLGLDPHLVLPFLVGKVCLDLWDLGGAVVAGSSGGDLDSERSSSRRLVGRRIRVVVGNRDRFR